MSTVLIESPYGKLTVVATDAWPAHRATGWTLIGRVGRTPVPGPRHARRLAAEVSE